MCELFGFTKARSVVTLTGKNGIIIAADTFFGSGLTAEEYEQKELDWAGNYARIIVDDN